MRPCRTGAPLEARENEMEIPGARSAWGNQLVGSSLPHIRSLARRLSGCFTYQVVVRRSDLISRKRRKRAG